MRPAISIDFGAAYTKVALRQEPNSSARLLAHEKLRLDEDHICIPTVAAWRERDDRWIFGGDAADLKNGEGIHVFRNWKPSLFMPPSEALDPQSSLGRLFYYNLESGGEDGSVRSIAVKFFEWILQVMLPSMIEFRDLRDPVIRVSIPDFQGETDYDYLIQEIIMEAGWPNQAVFCAPEPMTNLTGALSQGKNKMTVVNGTTQPDLNYIFSGSGMIDYINLIARQDVREEFTLMLVDIGAYTTDFSVVTLKGGGEEGLPPLQSHSIPYGIETLDSLVRHGMNSQKKAFLQHLTATEREAFRRTVYSEERSWSAGGVTIGEKEDLQVVEKCIRGMSTRIVNEIDEFLDRCGVSKVRETVFTGGGTNIPRIAMNIAEGLAPRGVETFHSNALPQGGMWRSVRLGHQVARASSALGGASVLFGDD